MDFQHFLLLVHSASQLHRTWSWQRDVQRLPEIRCTFRLLDDLYRLKWCIVMNIYKDIYIYRNHGDLRNTPDFTADLVEFEVRQMQARSLREDLAPIFNRMLRRCRREVSRLVAVVSWFIPRVFFCNFQQGTSGTPGAPGTCLLVYHWIVLDGQFSRFVHSHYTHTATSEGGRRQELKS